MVTVGVGVSVEVTVAVGVTVSVGVGVTVGVGLSVGVKVGVAAVLVGPPPPHETTELQKSPLAEASRLMQSVTVSQRKCPPRGS
jgi:hypothetical protein